MLTPLFTPSPFPDESPLGLIQRAATGNYCRNTLQFLRGLRCGLDDASTALPTLGHQESLFRKVCNRAGIKGDIRIYQKIGDSREGDKEWMGFRVPMSALPLKRWKFCPLCLASDGYNRALWDHRVVLACKRHGCLLRTSCSNCGLPTTYNRRIDQCLCGTRYAEMQVDVVANTQASFAEEIVNSGDQLQLDRIDAIYIQIADWSRYGLKLTESQMLYSVVSLFNDDWPECLAVTQSSAPDGLHPRVVLARLLNSKHKPVVQAANALLKRTTQGLCFRGTIAKDFRIAGDHAWNVLGIARAPFQKIVESGLLSILGKMFSIQEINTLLITAMGTADQYRSGISIHSLRSARFRTSLATVIRHIQRGECASLGYRPEQGLSGLVIASAPRQQTSALSGYYRVKDLMELMNVNEAAIRFLIKYQWIKADRINNSDGIFYGIRLEEAHDFHRKYCFSVDLPRSDQCSRRENLKRALTAGLAPVSGPRIDGAPTYLFKRADISALHAH